MIFWSEGESKLDLPAVLILLDDPVHRRGQVAFQEHRLQGDTEERKSIVFHVKVQFRLQSHHQQELKASDFREKLVL